MTKKMKTYKVNLTQKQIEAAVEAGIFKWKGNFVPTEPPTNWTDTSITEWWINDGDMSIVPPELIPVDILIDMYYTQQQWNKLTYDLKEKILSEGYNWNFLGKKDYDLALKAYEKLKKHSKKCVMSDNSEYFMEMFDHFVLNKNKEN